jgi:hypothetical protein
MAIWIVKEDETERVWKPPSFVHKKPTGEGHQMDVNPHFQIPTPHDISFSKAPHISSNVQTEHWEFSPFHV